METYSSGYTKQEGSNCRLRSKVMSEVRVNMNKKNNLAVKQLITTTPMICLQCISLDNKKNVEAIPALLLGRAEQLSV